MLAVSNFYREGSWQYGFLISCIGHLALLYCMISIADRAPNTLRKKVIYTVSLESSDELGGISQISKSKQKTPVAPPKKVATPAPEKPASKQTMESKEKAEVSLAEKKPIEKKIEKKSEPAKKIEAAKVTPKQPQQTAPAKKQTSSLSEINKNYQAAMQRYLGASTDAGGKGFGGDGLGGKGMGARFGQQKPPEWFIYKEQLETFIKRGWKWHARDADLYAVADFKISPSGVVSDIKLSLSSGNPKYDDSILRAISKASPVPPAPVNLYNDFEHVEMEFSPE